jgi:rRNA maturation endonuclease Nob1
MRLTKFNPETREYEYIKKAKTLEEFFAQRKAVIQKLGELEDRAEGEWKKVSDKYPRYVCTACNHLYNNKGYKYCPNCGARMKGENDG